MQVPCVGYNFASINGLVTDGNTKLCCCGFILELFQSATANKNDSEHTRDYKRLLPVCEAEILRVTVKQEMSQARDECPQRNWSSTRHI